MNCNRYRFFTVYNSYLLVSIHHLLNTSLSIYLIYRLNNNRKLRQFLLYLSQAHLNEKSNKPVRKDEVKNVLLNLCMQSVRVHQEELFERLKLLRKTYQSRGESTNSLPTITKTIGVVQALQKLNLLASKSWNLR